MLYVPTCYLNIKGSEFLEVDRVTELKACSYVPTAQRTLPSFCHYHFHAFHQQLFNCDFFSLTLLPTPQYFKIQFPNSFSPSLLKISQIHITLYDVILFKHIFLSMTVYLLLYPKEYNMRSQNIKNMKTCQMGSILDTIGEIYSSHKRDENTSEAHQNNFLPVDQLLL